MRKFWNKICTVLSGRSYNGAITSRSGLPDQQQKDFSVKAELKKLQEITKNPEMDKESVLLLNYGLPFLERMSFSSYKKMIDRAARTLDGYQGQVVLRSTSSLQKPNQDPVKAFQTYQVCSLITKYCESHYHRAYKSNLSIGNKETQKSSYFLLIDR